jgi:hypothetical protein
MGQVGGHVVAVVLQLHPPGVVDAGPQPALGPVVLDQHRGAGADHPVGAGGLGLQPGVDGLADGGLQQLPALVHAAGEDQHRAEGDRGVESGGGAAGGGTEGQAALP